MLCIFISQRRNEDNAQRRIQDDGQGSQDDAQRRNQDDAQRRIQDDGLGSQVDEQRRNQDDTQNQDNAQGRNMDYEVKIGL